MTVSNETTCDVAELISPAFYNPHIDITEGNIDQLVLRGGRGSAKSSYASIEGILTLVDHPEIHGVVMRKVSNTLRTTAYAQYVWAITVLGLYDKFKCTTQPMEITYLPTGQKIMFFGADDPGKIKSIKVPFGYIGYLHLEELDQFAGEEEVRNIEQSVLRGGDIAIEIKTFNPPRTKDNWANKYCLVEKPGQLIHTSTYQTTPPEWLGQRFLDDAEYLKQLNYAAYEHEYLGVANGTGGNVFDNVTIRDITDDEITNFDRLYYGIDWGWMPDPFAWGKMYFNAAQRKLYVFDEYVINKQSNKETADYLVEEKGITGGDMIIADSAEPKSINDYKSYGLYCVPVEKKPGSVNYRMKWMQSLTEIVIDSGRCPNAASEFLNYEYERDKDGNIISGYPDKNNHMIDAVSYGMFPMWRIGGE